MKTSLAGISSRGEVLSKPTSRRESKWHMIVFLNPNLRKCYILNSWALETLQNLYKGIFSRYSVHVLILIRSNCRSTETDGKSSSSECPDPNRSSKPEDASSSKCSDLTSANKNDSVLKLQIKKSEIVIKFGQKTNGEPSSEEAPLNDRKDTSVNIKIDDKENDPIVIDVVKKAQAEVVKDPVQIRFDFGQEDDRLCDRDDIPTSSSKLIPSSYCENSNSETDSGSHSPLLVNKSYASSETC